MNKKRLLTLAPIAAILLLASTQTVNAGDGTFPKIIYTPDGSAPEGFAIGRGSTAYNGSYDGSIYKVDLRSGEGSVLVPVQDPDIAGGACIFLGMRVDLRTNYLFVAGCAAGNAYVFDADSGAMLMEYQLGPPGGSIINDLTITEDAVYFTDSFRAVLYRLPLGKGGSLPLSVAGLEEITMPDEFAIDPAIFCCGGNGIVSTPDGKTLIVGHSNLGRIYRVDVASREVEEIWLDQTLVGFLDGIAMKGHTLYVMTPTVPTPIDGIQVIELAPDMRSGTLERIITDPDLDDVASGAIFGSSLYVNNARYSQFPGGDTAYWITKLKINKKK